ncbi:MAG: sigma 54-interacting transcriptional regulator [Treponemataceae bacterium]|nr:MAG: sigma 54-interacting transcriptional regulator [Treponemataceae bacterium]
MSASGLRGEVSDALSNERLKALIEINSIINSSYADVHGLYRLILKSAMLLVQCEASVLLLTTRGDDTSLRFVVSLGPHGFGKADFSIPIEESVAGDVYKNGKSLIINDLYRCDRKFNLLVKEKTGFDPRQVIAVPLLVDRCVGVIELMNKSDGKDFTVDDLAILELMSAQAALAYTNAKTFKTATQHITVLQNMITSGADFHTFVFESKVMADLANMVDQVAQTNSSVLILGESGVGKELLAEQIHLKSDRANKPFVRVNCAALSSQLLESELFGHVKGAYTDAISDRKGRFETADGGTLFMDEVGDIPIDVQSKLLRVLQTHSFEKVGSSETISADVRIVAATNRDLEEMVKEGAFRNDLFYRLNVLPIFVPPLRQRKDDIEPLAVFFLRKFNYETKKNFLGFTSEACRALHNYPWPGNIRELENCVERACVLGSPPRITETDLRLNTAYSASRVEDASRRVSSQASGKKSDRTLKTAVNSFKKAYITEILNETAWNKTETGKILGIQRTYLPRLISELGISERGTV